MCKWVKSGNQRIDPCLRETIKAMQYCSVKTLACCCGHGKYPPTVVYRNHKGVIFVDVIGVKEIPMPRKKRFYKRDADGIFFIPEVVAHLLACNQRQEGA